jgi:hypothetical protein
LYQRHPIGILRLERRRLHGDTDHIRRLP